MRSILALMRVSWLSFTSYRMNVLFSALSLIAVFLPIYFIAPALQPVVGDSIAGEGELYLGFLITGIAVLQIVGASMRDLPNAVSSGISSGTLEALFATPTPLAKLLIGMTGYGLLWAIFKGCLLITGFVVTGGPVAVGSIPLAAVILLLTIMAHAPVGILAAAMILVFRTAGPLVTGAAVAFSLLGGVYYSTSAIPEIVRPLSAFVPLTYGLRAFRRTLLAGEPLAAVLGDVSILAAAAVVLLGASLLIFAWSLRYAQRAGSLSQY